MTLTLRIILMIASILNCLWVLGYIRKSQVKIEDSVFWIIFSGLLILISALPGLIEIGMWVTGVQSAVNFVFLSIIFVLIIKVFRLSVKISQLENRLQSFVQVYAIDKLNNNKKLKKTDLK